MRRATRLPQHCIMPLKRFKIDKTDVIPLINSVYWRTFGNVETNRKAIAERGWNPFNRALLDHPEVSARQTNIIDDLTKAVTQEQQKAAHLSNADVTNDVLIRASAAPPLPTINLFSPTEKTDALKAVKRLTAGTIFRTGTIAFSDDTLKNKIQSRLESKALAEQQKAKRKRIREESKKSGTSTTTKRKSKQDQLTAAMQKISAQKSIGDVRK